MQLSISHTKGEIQKQVRPPKAQLKPKVIVTNYINDFLKHTNIDFFLKKDFSLMKELRCFSSISSNTKVEGIKPNCCLALFQEKRSSMSEIACLLQSQGPEEASPGSSWL